MREMLFGASKGDIKRNTPSRLLRKERGIEEGW